MNETSSQSPNPEVQTLDPVRLVWDLFTSPVTFMLSAAGFACLVALGTFISQGATEAALLGERSYSATRALLGLGFNDLTTSWVLWFTGLLLLINTIGMVIRYVWTVPHEARDWTSPAIDCVTHQSNRSMESLTAALVGRGRVASRRGCVVVRQGLWAEGLIIGLIGLIMLLGAVLLDRTTGVEARVEVLGTGSAAPATEPTPLVVKMREDGAWIDRQLPFTARCADMAAATPTRGWRCTLTRTLASVAGAPPRIEEARVVLGPGWPAEAFGLTFHIERERPLPGRRDLIRLVDGAGALVYAGPAARTATLPGGEALTPFGGPDGPMVVVTPPDGAPYLLTPSMDAQATPTQVGEVSLSTLPAWHLILGASRRPGNPLVWVGIGLLVFALSLLVALPHLTLIAHEVDGVVTVRAWSFNRGNLATTTLKALEEAT